MSASARSSKDGASALASGSKSSGGASFAVRDFVYLDTDRIHSYLSQIEGGFRLFVQKVEEAIQEEQERHDDGSTLLKLLLTASGGAGIGPLVKGTVELQSGLELGAPSKINAYRTRQSASNAATIMLHHYAFQIVFDRMRDRFALIKGKASLLPAEDFMTIAENADRHRSEISEHYVAAAKKLGLQNILYIESPNERAYALLLSEHLLVSPMHFLLTYGAPTTRDFTLVGIDVGPRSSRKAPTQAANLAKLMFEATKEIEKALEELIGSPPGKSIYPIAVFSEL